MDSFNVREMSMRSVTQEQLAEARQTMIETLFPWVMKRFPQLRLETLEANIAAFMELKKYADACAICLSTEQCPGRDGNCLQGSLAPDGIVNLWYIPCPKGMRPPRHATQEPESERRWVKQ